MSSKQLEQEIEGLKKDLRKALADRDAIYRAGDASINALQGTIHELNDRIQKLELELGERENQLAQLVQVLDNVTRSAKDFIVPPKTNGKKP